MSEIERQGSRRHGDERMGDGDDRSERDDTERQSTPTPAGGVVGAANTAWTDPQPPPIDADSLRRASAGATAGATPPDPEP